MDAENKEKYFIMYSRCLARGPNFSKSTKAAYRFVESEIHLVLLYNFINIRNKARDWRMPSNVKICKS